MRNERSQDRAVLACHFEPIDVDFQALDFRVEGAREQAEFDGDT